MKIIRIMFVLIGLFSAFILNAQQEIPMADTLRSEGKIYVVVAIILVVFIGIVIYLFSLDRKVSRLEKNNEKKKG